MKIGETTILSARTPHPLLGECVAIEHGGAIVTEMTPVDWDRPARIPTVAAPGKLPPGVGAAILNTIAERAAAAGVRALRYAGPYPTPALYRALARSFRCREPEDRFCEDVLGRAMRLARDEIAIDFVPAPHRRVRLGCGWSEVRDGAVERVVIDGIGFEAGGSPARFHDGSATIWFGDAIYAHVVQVADDGTLVDGPHPIPPSTSAVIGREFPPALRVAIGELVADLVPAPLAIDARRVLADRTIRWADLGARAVRATGMNGSAGFEVHAAIWDRVSPHGLGRVALALAEALAPAVAAQIVSEI